MRRTGGTREPSFFLVASHQRCFVVMATTHRYFFHHLVVVLSEGTLRRTGGCLGNTPIFLQFVNGIHGTADGLNRVVLLGMVLVLSRFDSFEPLLLAATPLPPFLLLTGDRTLNGRPYLFLRFSYSSEESIRRKVKGSREDEGSGPLGVRNPGVFFLVPGSPVRVLRKMLSCARSSSHTVPGGLSLSYVNFHPLCFQHIP